MVKLIQGENDFETWCKDNNREDLLKQWHPTKNGDLTPKKVTAHSNKYIWWVYPYDDPNTGKHFNFEWKVTVNARVQGSECPYLSNQKIWIGFNDLGTTHPKLAEQWHPTKNGDLTPQKVTHGNSQKVWWYYPYDDPNTGKHFDFEWQSVISTRASERWNNEYVCPFLTDNSQVWYGFNDVETWCRLNKRECLLDQWDYELNAKEPKDFTYGSNKTVHWKLLYYDENRKKEFLLKWKDTISHRTIENRDCPYIGEGRTAVYTGFNDLESMFPLISKEWDYTKNKDLTPQTMCWCSGKKVYWLCENKHSFYQSIAHRTASKENCPYCSGSKAERLLYNILKDFNISFKREKSFDDMLIKDKRYDIYIRIGKGLLLELDGAQHFTDKYIMFENQTPFSVRRKKDNLKNDYCLRKGIPLLRIPYTYNPDTEKEKIEQMVLNFIETRKVPPEIIDFYDQYKENNNYAEIARKLNAL